MQISRSIERPFGAWFDAEGDRAVAILLAIFLPVWTLFNIAANASIGLHPDMVEVFEWGQHIAPGYSKHPPLAALTTRVWFSFFPTTDWAFYLLAMANATLALFAVDLIARRYLSGDKRLLVLLLLLLTPFYQFHSVRFASNQTLLSAWPIATYCFIRAFETRVVSWAIAAGVTAAVAMLGKYFSIFLLIGFAAAALAHPDRWRYLRSGSPLISAVVGLLVLSPHIHWLMTTGYQTFAYARESHPARSVAAALKADVFYATGAIGFVALPLLAYWLCVRPSRATLAEAFRPADPNRRMLVILLAIPLIAPMIVAPFIKASLVSIWTMQAWFLLPVVLLLPSSAVVERRRAIGVAIAVAAMTLGSLIASPVVAWMKHVKGTNEDRAYFQGMSNEVERLWKQTTDQKLSIVLGERVAGFYIPSHPDVVPGFKYRRALWVTPERLAHEGWAAVCVASDQGCVDQAQALAAGNAAAKRYEFGVTPRFFGRDARPEKFVMIASPPKP